MYVVHFRKPGATRYRRHPWANRSAADTYMQLLEQQGFEVYITEEPYIPMEAF